MKLLSEEEIKAFRLEAQRRAAQLAKETEGNFNQGDMHAIFDDAEQVKLEAQARLTAQEVTSIALQYMTLGKSLACLAELKKEFGVK